MCLICTDLIKGKLTSKEARKNLDEIIEEIDETHFMELMGLVWDKEKEEKIKNLEDK